MMFGFGKQRFWAIVLLLAVLLFTSLLVLPYLHHHPIRPVEPQRCPLHIFEVSLQAILVLVLLGILIFYAHQLSFSVPQISPSIPLFRTDFSRAPPRQ